MKVDPLLGVLDEKLRAQAEHYERGGTLFESLALGVIEGVVRGPFVSQGLSSLGDLTNLPDFSHNRLCGF